MRYSYQRAENNAVSSQKKQYYKKNIDELKDTIIFSRDGMSIIEDGLKKEEGLTIEQEFIKDYYDMSEEEATKFTLSNEINKKVVLDDEMEEKRYNALIDYISQFISVDKEIYGLNPKFYPEIHSYNDYTKTINDDPLIVKKIRICQLLNKAAHEFSETLKKIVSYETFDKFRGNHDCVKDICYILRRIYSNSYDDKTKSESKQELTKYKIDLKKLNENDLIQYMTDVQSYFYNQKKIYTIDIIEYLQKNQVNMNYGFNEKGDGVIFDVPMYGQVAVHFGLDKDEILENVGDTSSIEKYNGYFLRPKNFILAKADPNLLKQVDINELNIEEKALYDVLISEKIIEKKDLVTLGDEDINELNITGNNDEISNIDELTHNEKINENSIKSIEEYSIEELEALETNLDTEMEEMEKQNAELAKKLELIERIKSKMSKKEQLKIEIEEKQQNMKSMI